VSLPQGDTVAAYEGLRSAVLSAQIGGCSGLGIFRRAGLATWMREVAGDGQSQTGCPDQDLPGPAISPVATPPSALTGLMAEIVLTFAKETALA
jgi:hypothetical protein